MPEKPFLEVKINENDAKYLEIFRKINSKNLNQAMRDFLKNEITPRIVREGRQNAADRLVDNSKGTLERNMQGTVSVRSGFITMKFGVFRGPAKTYYATQEFGTKYYNPESPIETIFPTRSKYLTVPNLDDPKAKRGGAGNYPEKLIKVLWGAGGQRGNVAGALFPKSKIKKSKKNLGDLTAAYFLMSYVDVPPRYMFFDALQANLPWMLRNISDFAAQTLIRESKRDSKIASYLRRYNLG